MVPRFVPELSGVSERSIMVYQCCVYQLRDLELPVLRHFNQLTLTVRHTLDERDVLRNPKRCTVDVEQTSVPLLLTTMLTTPGLNATDCTLRIPPALARIVAAFASSFSVILNEMFSGKSHFSATGSANADAENSAAAANTTRLRIFINLVSVDCPCGVVSI